MTTDACTRFFDRIFAEPQPDVRAKFETELAHLRALRDPAKLEARIKTLETALEILGPRQ